MYVRKSFEKNLVLVYNGEAKTNNNMGNWEIPLKAKRRKDMAEITFAIKENIGVLAESAKGWTKELNLVSWNDKPAKYDIREWDPLHEKMGKGITFSTEELRKLKELLNEMEL